LVPEAFGVVATLTMVVSFAEIFVDAGFQKYLVQHEFADQEDLEISTNVAFWSNLLLSILTWVGISLFATPIANAVGSAGCEAAIVVMCAQIPMLAFSSIQMARYRRDFDFKGLFVARIATAAVPLVVTVPLTFVFRSYWALVAGMLTRDFFNTIILTTRSKWKPRFCYSIPKLKEMISFSLWTMVENISIWLTNYMGTFIIGSHLSAYYVGLYKTATGTVSSYLGLVTTATMPVLFSALSRCQRDNIAFRDNFFRFQRMAALLVVPLGVGLFVYRELATLILLGSQWLQTADLLGYWSLASAIVIILSHYNSEAFRSKGYPRLSVLVQVLYLLVMIPVLLWGAKQEYQILSAAAAFARMALVLISGIFMQKIIGIRFFEVLQNVWPSFFSSAIMMAVGTCLRTLFDNVVWEVTTVLMCICVYAISMLLLPAGRKQLAEIPILRKLFRLKVKGNR
jgi:PST family polysaccharide transporter